MYTAAVIITILVIAMQYQLSSLKGKVSELKAENELLKSSLKIDSDKLSTSLSMLDDYVDGLGRRVDRLENEDVHGFADDISFLKAWVKNVGKIATSTRDKVNPSMDN
ncbi:hypothetical protein [Klebsiella aerogenes]|uniref:hypothetical protein n=1 Tax=Klebsiella aerogenes TaxID=548 RepID=UPI0007B3DEA5|nr:hypothetical protein [Klebsiella aerogenes]